MVYVECLITNEIVWWPSSFDDEVDIIQYTQPIYSPVL
jgi:hypothetical protein